MSKVSRKVFEAGFKQQNTHTRLQPNAGTKLDARLINLCIYHTPKPSVWQRVRGWLS